MSNVEYGHAPKPGAETDAVSVRENFDVIEEATSSVTDDNIERASINTRHLSPASGAFKSVVDVHETIATPPPDVAALGVDTTMFATPLTITCEIGSPIIVSARVQFRTRSPLFNNGNGYAWLDLVRDGATVLESAALQVGTQPHVINLGYNAGDERSTIPIFALFTATAQTHTINVIAKAANTENFDFGHIQSSITAMALDT